MCTILAADSRVEILGLYDQILGELGYPVALCTSSNACYTLARRLKPSLILLDLRLPTVDHGITALKALHLDPDTRSIPILVCTADHIAAHTHATWLQAHHWELLKKPFDVNIFLSTIEQMLAGATMCNRHT